MERLELDPLVENACGARLEISGQPCQVSIPIALGHDRLVQAPADRLLGTPAEHLFGHRVPGRYHTMAVHADHGIERGGDDLGEPLMLGRGEDLADGSARGTAGRAAAPSFS